MGTVHKFKRPPKNEQQFKGYRPGSVTPRQKPGLWRRLRPWQQTVLGWLLLIAVAAGIVGVRALLAGRL